MNKKTCVQNPDSVYIFLKGSSHPAKIIVTPEDTAKNHIEHYDVNQTCWNSKIKFPNAKSEIGISRLSRPPEPDIRNAIFQNFET